MVLSRLSPLLRGALNCFKQSACHVGQRSDLAQTQGFLGVEPCGIAQAVTRTRMCVLLVRTEPGESSTTTTFGPATSSLGQGRWRRLSSSSRFRLNSEQTHNLPRNKADSGTVGSSVRTGWKRLRNIGSRLDRHRNIGPNADERRKPRRAPFGQFLVAKRDRHADGVLLVA